MIINVSRLLCRLCESEGVREEQKETIEGVRLLAPRSEARFHRGTLEASDHSKNQSILVFLDCFISMPSSAIVQSDFSKPAVLDYDSLVPD